jgi:hypothetical protein
VLEVNRGAADVVLRCMLDCYWGVDVLMSVEVDVLVC